MAQSKPAPPLILACSPRQGGNCAAAAGLFAQALGQAAGLPAPPAVTRLSSFSIAPCLACSACANPRNSPGLAFGCPQSAGDQSALLLRALTQAPALCFIAPIFFYHLPSPLKALLDRTQPFWLRQEAKSFAPRTCRAILIAGRSQGKKLFEGSLLSLSYALKALNIRLADPLLLRGLESPGDLLASKTAVQAVLDYGRQAGLCP
ncbi:MAG: NAD(P)H-dependent oxidoreductase [Deltaproteobacteria bacterium]|jgi:multimeric flavodoxin WrbA|nr:NAD(P)H-dependent oxidoreductase [Deltaproteobacteria bacterium]